MTKTILWTALITPFDEQGEIDFNDLKRLLLRQEDAGNGILILGSTGEGLALQEEEKKQIISFTSEMNLKVPVMAGIGGFQLHKQLSLIDFCNNQNIDALLLVVPLYAKPALEGQYEWFSSLMETTSKPCMIYNVPSRTGAKLHPEVPARIKAGFDHLFGVKEASGSITEFQIFRENAPSVDFYSGDDALTPFFCAAGAKGLVSVASNVWPEATHKYVQLCLDGKTDEVLPLWKNVSEELFKAPNPVPAKTLLKENGVIRTATVRAPLSLKDLHTQKSLTEADRAVKAWFEK